MRKALADRSNYIVAQASTDIEDWRLLRELVDLVVTDTAKNVRVEVVRAIGEVGGTQSMLLLRLKALGGHTDAEVIGEFFSALLRREKGDRGRKSSHETALVTYRKNDRSSAHGGQA